MSSLPNPWDPAFRMNNNHSMNESITRSNGLSTGTGATPSAVPPPLPSRPSTSFSSTPYQSTFPSFPMSGIGGVMSGYGPFSMHNRPMMSGGYGEPNITQVVESQLRPGFDSIYSVVQAFSSVSVMLESTYFALQNSVRAAVGMADNFSRIGTQLRSLLVAFPIISWLYKAVRRILAWLGIIKADPERVMAALQQRSVENQRQGGRTAAGPSWPMMMFLSIAIGGPILIWQLLRSLLKVQHKQAGEWSSGQAEHYVAKGLFEFSASREDELSFKSGDSLRVAPKNLQPNINGWLLASHGSRIGLIPANHVNILGRMLPNGQSESKDEKTDTQLQMDISSVSISKEDSELSKS